MRLRYQESGSKLHSRELNTVCAHHQTWGEQMKEGGVDGVCNSQGGDMECLRYINQNAEGRSLAEI